MLQNSGKTTERRKITIAQKHRIIETSCGEVMLTQEYDPDEYFCNVYIGDNYDDYVGEIDGSIYDDEETLAEKVEKIL